MQSLNRVTIIGNVGQDPEIRQANNGSQIVNLSVATTQSWTDKNTGQKQERTEWHRVVAFEPLSKQLGEWVRKGHPIFVEGELRTRKWQDSNGQDRYSTEVVMQGFNGQFKSFGRSEGQGQAPAQGQQRPPQRQQQQRQQQPQYAPQQQPDPLMDADIPF